MVRLKGVQYTEHQSITEFQFHYGTIKSERTQGRAEQGQRFQFHYGTIKSH